MVKKKYGYLYQCTFAANRHVSLSELHYSFPVGFYDYRLFYIFLYQIKSFNYEAFSHYV